MLPTDVINKIKSDFNADEALLVENLLSGYDGNEPDRVIRCILHLANGSYQRLEHNLQNANMDYRDVIMFAEYDKEDRKINDFSKPFS